MPDQTLTAGMITADSISIDTAATDAEAFLARNAGVTTSQNVVAVRDLPYYAFSSISLLPYFGEVHLLYVPDGRSIASHHISAAVDLITRTPCTQERLTVILHDVIGAALDPRGVLILIEGRHPSFRSEASSRRMLRLTTRAASGVLDEALHRQAAARLYRDAGGMSTC